MKFLGLNFGMLHRLNVMLDPRKSLNVEDIGGLATSYYPLEFIEHERKLLKLELQNYEIDVENEKFLSCVEVNMKYEIRVLIPCLID